MKQIKSLPYVNSYKDRLGGVRHYLRRRGSPRTPLPGTPGSREFMAAYLVAIGSDVALKVKTPPPLGEVYYLSDGELVKIGFTRNWGERQKSYLLHSGRELKLLAKHPGTLKDERAIHRKFEKGRTRGEWFKYTDTLERLIRETAREHVSRYRVPNGTS